MKNSTFETITEDNFDSMVIKFRSDLVDRFHEELPEAFLEGRDRNFDFEDWLFEKMFS